MGMIVRPSGRLASVLCSHTSMASSTRPSSSGGGSITFPPQLCSIKAAVHSMPSMPQSSMIPTGLRPRTWPRHVVQARGKTDLVCSIRAMPIKLVRCSKDNSKPAQDMAQEWLAKLSRYTAVTEVVVKPNPKGAASPEVQKAAEAEKVLKAIAPGERVVLLDERGRDASSEDMARLLIKASDDGTPLCFVIGGPFGHGPAVLQRGDESVRLSRMVLNHSVAYIVLVEQLYRAWTIVRGEPYHH